MQCLKYIGVRLLHTPSVCHQPLRVSYTLFLSACSLCRKLLLFLSILLESVTRQVYLAAHSAQGGGLDILEELLHGRRELAGLLGSPSWAHYQVQSDRRAVLIHSHVLVAANLVFASVLANSMSQQSPCVFRTAWACA